MTLVDLIEKFKEDYPEYADDSRFSKAYLDSLMRKIELDKQHWHNTILFDYVSEVVVGMTQEDLVERYRTDFANLSITRVGR